MFIFSLGGQVSAVLTMYVYNIITKKCDQVFMNMDNEWMDGYSQSFLSVSIYRYKSVHKSSSLW